MKDLDKPKNERSWTEDLDDPEPEIIGDQVSTDSQQKRSFTDGAVKAEKTVEIKRPSNKRAPVVSNEKETEKENKKTAMDTDQPVNEQVTEIHHLLPSESADVHHPVHTEQPEVIDNRSEEQVIIDELELQEYLDYFNVTTLDELEKKLAEHGVEFLDETDQQKSMEDMSAVDIINQGSEAQQQVEQQEAHSFKPQSFRKNHSKVDTKKKKSLLLQPFIWIQKSVK